VVGMHETGVGAPIVLVLVLEAVTTIGECKEGTEVIWTRLEITWPHM
jgi:hypothetical protein